ncbi:MAG: helix-turn-helix domain-containing protein [Candidatus Helarchaeota archaeon]
MSPKSNENVSNKLNQVLKVFGLSDQEIDTYFKISGKKSVLKKDISKAMGTSTDETDLIIENLISKGLLKKLPGKKLMYQALPPYSALISQTSQIKTIISELQKNTPENLESKIKDFNGESLKIDKIQEYRNFIERFKDELPILVNKELKSLQSGLEQIRKLKNFNKFVKDIKMYVLKELNTEFSHFRQMFDNIKLKISNVFEKQLRISALKSFVDKIVTKIVSEEFGQVQEFEKRFAIKIDETINNTLKKFSGLPQVPDRYSFSVTDTSEHITNKLINALSDSDSKLAEIEKEISKSYTDVKKEIVNEIYKIIETDVFKRISEQIEHSEKIMKQFWDVIKYSSMIDINKQEK